MTAPATRIAEHLGGRKVLHRTVRSELDLAQAVREGFPPAAVDRLAHDMELTRDDVFRLIVPKRTLADRRARRARLNRAASERVARLARVFTQAEEVFGTGAKARIWLRRANRALGGRAPLDLLDTEPGARLVEDELTRIAYGVYA